MKKPTLFEMMRFSVFAFLIGTSCLGCQREYPLVISEAWVAEDSVKVFLTADRPALVIVEYGVYGGGCTGYYDTLFSWQEDNTYHLDVRMSAPHPDDTPDCTDDAYIQTEQFILGYLDPGRYTVHVNEILKEFEITPERGCKTIE